MIATVIAILANIFNLSVEEIVPDLVIRDLRMWDSLRHMDLIMQLEKASGIELTFDEIVSIKTIADIKVILEGRGLWI